MSERLLAIPGMARFFANAVNTNELDYIYKIKLIKNTAVDKNLIENIYRC